ncbi:MAG: hypothetical protein H7Z13_16800 [Ferruginibacter sp.]|nr:hypothetical protein [Ferruginibacter sp.]
MENSIQNFAESIEHITQLEDQQSDFNLQAVDTPGPGDEDEDEGEGEDQGEDQDQGEGEGGDNPPLDPTIVHSPVRTQTGGMPQQQPQPE